MSREQGVILLQMTATQMLKVLGKFKFKFEMIYFLFQLESRMTQPLRGGQLMTATSICQASPLPNLSTDRYSYVISTPPSLSS